ncbi:MAG: 2-oxoglutarate synthase [Peptococcaceae bacterium BRH_c4a]|nr:MAG: 2-oxoglutarate synthase [Peptococcaceae bacterium BRH_c4a]
MHPLGEKYIRKGTLPYLWCPGCGNGIVLHATLSALDELNIMDRIALVGGIGCSGWIPTYINADTMHVLHGRTIPFATGLKMSDRDRKVVVFSGDGDCLGIGGNHFIHGARRNIDITVVMIHNQIYGMTGGQVAPTTPYNGKTKTSPYGNNEPPFDACELARVAGASFVARWTTAHPRQLSKTIQEAISHEGFSFIEVLTQCPTQAGRVLYGTANAAKLLDMLKESTISITAAKNKSAEELQGKLLVGKLYHDECKPEFTSCYYRRNNAISSL